MTLLRDVQSTLSCNQCTKLAQSNVLIRVSSPKNNTIWLCTRDHELVVIKSVVRLPLRIIKIAIK